MRCETWTWMRLTLTGCCRCHEVYSNVLAISWWGIPHQHRRNTTLYGAQKVQLMRHLTSNYNELMNVIRTTICYSVSFLFLNSFKSFKSFYRPSILVLIYNTKIEGQNECISNHQCFINKFNSNNSTYRYKESLSNDLTTRQNDWRLWEMTGQADNDVNPRELIRLHDSRKH